MNDGWATSFFTLTGEDEEFQDFHESFMGIGDCPFSFPFCSREPRSPGCFVLMRVANLCGNRDFELERLEFIQASQGVLYFSLTKAWALVGWSVLADLPIPSLTAIYSTPGMGSWAYLTKPSSPALLSAKLHAKFER